MAPKHCFVASDAPQHHKIQHILPCLLPCPALLAAAGTLHSPPAGAAALLKLHGGSSGCGSISGGPQHWQPVSGQGYRHCSSNQQQQQQPWQQQRRTTAAPAAATIQSRGASAAASTAAEAAKQGRGAESSCYSSITQSGQHSAWLSRQAAAAAGGSADIAAAMMHCAACSACAVQCMPG